MILQLDHRTHRFDPNCIEDPPRCESCDEPFEEGDEVFVAVDETPLIGGDRETTCRSCHDYDLWGVAR